MYAFYMNKWMRLMNERTIEWSSHLGINWKYQGPVVRKVDNAVILALIHWIVIYPVDSVIQPLNNRRQNILQFFVIRSKPVVSA